MADRGSPGREVLRCAWETRGRLPYFANLKAMRVVLRELREALGAVGGALRAYVFLEDRLVFIAEGAGGELEPALAQARARAAEAFAASDRKVLWGDVLHEDASGEGRTGLLAPLRRLPVEAGLASDVAEYPWAGGDWLISGG